MSRLEQALREIGSSLKEYLRRTDRGSTTLDKIPGPPTVKLPGGGVKIKPIRGDQSKNQPQGK